MKEAYPDSTIDYLVFKGAEKIIGKNPLISRIITVPEKKHNLGLLFSLYRKYDVAFAAYPSDRTVVAAALAGRRSYGLAYRGHKELLRRLLLHDYHYISDKDHVVSAIGSLAGMVGASPVNRVTMAYDNADFLHAGQLPVNSRYVLMHPYSMKQCKYWPARYWGELSVLIHQHTNCTVAFTVTPAADDKSYLEEILAYAPQNVVQYPCTLSQFAAALKNCTAYVGIDTAATHIAAAMEVPTVALYGPSLTSYWAPWPNGCAERSPFSANKGTQYNGYVTVIQKDWDCVPCNKETCSVSNRNRMECLEAITPEEVFREVLNNVTRHNRD